MNLVFASKICPDAVQRLQRDHHVVCAWSAGEEELKEMVRDAEALVFRSGVQISAQLMQCAPRLQLLIRAGSGLDNLDLDYVRLHGLELQRIPEPGARAVAELAFGLMLALARQLLTADAALRKGHWLKNSVEGYLLQNKVLGIVGSGNIGTTVGELGLAWGMRAIACVEHPSAERAASLALKGIHLGDLDTVLRTADFVTLHVPLQDSTRNLIGPAELSRMKPGSYLVNLARGGVVDEEALYHALTRANGLKGAALDVHALEGEGRISVLAGLPNVVLTPHIGATTVDSQREIGRRIEAIIAAQMAANPS